MFTIYFKMELLYIFILVQRLLFLFATFDSKLNSFRVTTFLSANLYYYVILL